MIWIARHDQQGLKNKAGMSKFKKHAWINSVLSRVDDFAHLQVLVCDAELIGIKRRH